MSVTIQKKTQKAKTKAKAKAKVSVSGLAEKVDAFGENYSQMAEIKLALKPFEERHKTMYSELAEVVDNKYTADEPAQLTGHKKAAKFSAHGKMGHVTNAKKAFELLEAVQPGLAWELMGFPLGQLQKYLTPAQFEQVTEYEPKRARTVTVVDLEG